MKIKKSMEFTDMMGMTDSVVSPEYQHTPTSYGNFDEVLMNAPDISQEQRENIVNAVNCHEEMRELLADVRTFFKDQLKNDFGSRIDNTIAKAEGR